MRASACLLFLLMLSVTAPAEARRVDKAPAKSHASKLSVCDPAGHTATFTGSMRVLKNAPGMEMLFRLLVKGDDAERFVDAGAPAPFGQWQAADMGNRRYILDRTVANLPIGSSYRVQVRYRWRDAAGKVVAKGARRTKPCAQPDTRPNLHIQSVRPGELYPDGSREFEVGYLNDSTTDILSGFSISLAVSGMPAQIVTDGSLAAGDRNDAVFTLPVCPAGGSITAVVDSGLLIDEDDEADNTITVPCPT